MSIAVGAVFVLRDFAQREAGHWVIGAMLLGALLSWAMADAFVALASLSAFAVSEGAEWAIYTWTRRPFAQRIWISTLCATPIDSAVFLAMIGHLSAEGVIAMTASKMAGAFIVWRMVRPAQQRSIA
jgi:uncharacterized PurR-regulated membrane protein YhhQ (DUF165 family)